MSPLLKSSLFTAALVAGLAAPGREAKAQATYVGSFALTNGASVKCLTGGYDSLGNPTDLERAPWAATPAQEWAFFLLPNGFYAIMNVQTTLFMHAGSGDGLDYLIAQKQWDADLYQQWYLYPLGNHFYVLVNVGSGKMLTDPNNNSDGTFVEEDTWVDSLNQWWYFYFLFK